MTATTEGRLLVGLPTPEQAAGLRRTLLAWGWAPHEVVDCPPLEALDVTAAPSGDAADRHSLRDELRVLQRFTDLGHSWLLVAVDDAECACQAARTASLWGASTAIPFDLQCIGSSH
jgi:hypothetical protein